MLEENRVSCKNCPYCNVVTEATDEADCLRLKCMATKKGKTITWSMCEVGVNVYQRFADYVERHEHPKWCPVAETNREMDPLIRSYLEEATEEQKL